MNKMPLFRLLTSSPVQDVGQHGAGRIVEIDRHDKPPQGPTLKSRLGEQQHGAGRGGRNPIPSAIDLACAWPWYIYLIVSVRQGHAEDARGWVLTEDDNNTKRRFADVPIRSRTP